MSSKLPINLEDLLRQRKVEGDRVEYKKGWNPDPITRTLCAFANDFENFGGDFLKELDLTEGRSTGISKVLKVMKENGSPRPEFETDDDRSYFLIRLSAHPKVESDESTRSGTKEKTSGKTSGKILTEIRNNRNVTIAELSERLRDIRTQRKRCSGTRCWIFMPSVSTISKLFSSELHLKYLDLSVKCYILCVKDRL